MMVMLSHGLGVGRALPVRRRDLRSAAHPRDRPLRRARRSTCRATRCCSCCSPWPSVGPAGHQQLRRRVPGAGGHLSGVELGDASSATTGIILGAAYMLYLYWRVAFGDADERGRGGDAGPVDLRELADARPDRALRCCGWASIPKASCAPMRAGYRQRARRARARGPAPKGDARPRSARRGQRRRRLKRMGRAH